MTVPKVQSYALELALWGDNETQVAIARRYGFNYNTLCKIIERSGIPKKFQGRKLRPGIWSKVSPGGCLCCGTNKKPHRARGLCKACYNRMWRQDLLFLYPTEAETAQLYIAEELDETDET